VKLLAISMSILLMVFFVLMPAFAQPPGGQLPPLLRTQKQPPEKKAERKPIKDANSADANSVTDPNKPAYMMFEGLEEALKRVNKESRKEIREWTRSTAEDKTSLVKAVQEQVMAEFNFLRELAVEEGAEKTVAAIDGLIADREKRFEEITQKMEEARKRLRKREERRGKDRDRTREREPRRRDREDRSKRTPGPSGPF
jgi:hypothetical protein